MALHLDLAADDILIVPTDSGAQIRVGEKSGRRTRVTVESAKPVRVLRGGADQAPPTQIPRPVPQVEADRPDPNQTPPKRPVR